MWLKSNRPAESGGDAPKLPKPELREKNAKESFYDKIPLTLKQLDIIIVVVIIVLIAAFALGVLIGNGIISGPRF